MAHGKSTVVKAISGVQTVRFKNELERNITIKLGYANAKIYKCPTCERPQCFKAHSSSKEDNPPCDYCSGPMDLVRHVSFVDCPGHDILMATMLNGAAVMDGALLLVAANESCPQPQTSEHLAAVEIMRLKDIIILQVCWAANSSHAQRSEAAACERHGEGGVGNRKASWGCALAWCACAHASGKVCLHDPTHAPPPFRHFTSAEQDRSGDGVSGSEPGGVHPEVHPGHHC